MLELEKVTRYFGDHAAVDEVSFHVSPGELVGFVGANGAGKTTTMRLILGLLAIHRGEVRWDGHPITEGDRRRFGYMPEERGLYPKQKIQEQLAYLGRLAGQKRHPATERAGELLDQLGLSARANDQLESLSLGNQQRVQVAAALINTPAALILDEPFSGLDPKAVDAMTFLLREQADAGVPILFSSHQLDLIERLCDRLVILSAGRVVASGTPQELCSHGEVRHRIRLGGPADWLHSQSQVDRVEVDGTAATLTLRDWTTDELLAAATQRGSVLELIELRPSLSEVYREVTLDATAA